MFKQLSTTIRRREKQATDGNSTSTDMNSLRMISLNYEHFGALNCSNLIFIDVQCVCLNNLVCKTLNHVCCSITSNWWNIKCIL